MFSGVKYFRGFMKKIIFSFLFFCVMVVSSFAIDVDTIKKACRDFSSDENATCIEINYGDYGFIYIYAKQIISLHFFRGYLTAQTMAGEQNIGQVLLITSIKYSKGVLSINF